MTARAFDQFKENIERVRYLHLIYHLFITQTTKAIDISDVLRAELVLAVSALDYYIHEVVKEGMLEVFQGKRIETPSFKKFNISLESVKDAIINPTSFDWLDNEIMNRHSWKSFQQSEKLAEAIRLISEMNLWNEIATKSGKSPIDLKKQLDIIVDRRNKIAHEADIDPSFPGNRWPIDEDMVKDAIDFIEELVETIEIIIQI